MRKVITWFSRENEKGSTILEVLLTLFILSTLGIGAWHAAGVSLRMATRIRHSLMASARLLQLDDHLRSLAGRVLPPYWAPDQVVDISDNTLTAPYLDGIAERSLAMSFKNGVLEVGDGQHSIQYSEFQRVTFSAATAGQNQYGVTVRLEWTDGNALMMTARFGGTPVGGMESR